MQQDDTLFAGSIPALYDRYLGPLIFAPYADDLASRVSATVPASVLEVATGTGIVSRALAETLPGTTRIVATDLNEAMIEHAATRLDAPNVEWRQADALALPFADGEFDVVVCQFSVMFFPDRIAAYREALRVLGPGGSFIFNVWDRIEENEIPMAVSDAVAELFPGDPPQFLRRTPHGYHDTEAITSELREAGFARVEFETVEHRSRASSPDDPAIGFCQGTPLRNEIEARDASRLGEATEAASQAVRRRFGDGPIEGKIQAHIFSATAWMRSKR